MEDRLRKFAKVIDSGSYTRAAEALHISQPALSTALHKLERELGAQLIIRGRHRLELTEAGEAAYVYAKQLSIQTDNFKSHMAALTNEKPTAKIGMIDSIANALLVDGDQLANLDVHVHISLLSVNNSRRLIEAVSQNELDIALVVTPDKTPPQTIRVTPLGNEPLIGVAGPKRYQAVKKARKIGKFPDFIDYDEHSYTSRLIRRHLMSTDIELQTVFHSTSPEITLHLVRSGRGTGVLPYTLVAPYIAQGTLFPVSPPIQRPIASICRKDKVLPQALADLNRTVQTVLARQNALIKDLSNN